MSDGAESIHIYVGPYGLACLKEQNPYIFTSKYKDGLQNGCIFMVNMSMGCRIDAYLLAIISMGCRIIPYLRANMSRYATVTVKYEENREMAPK